MEKEKKAIYKKWWFWVIVILIVLVFASAGSSDNKEVNTTETTSNPSTSKVKVTVIDFSSMSKADVQSWCDTNKVKCNITEEYSDTIEKGLFVSQSVKTDNTIYEGDKITVTYSLGKEPTLGQKNALSKAKSYLSHQSFSYKRLIEQLEYEQFSHEEATYGADNCGADWNEQAAKKAKSYMSNSSFSKKRLIEQLEYEGFTKEQAEYGVSTVGF